MNVFISYTRRDGRVTAPLLGRLRDHLAGVCTPFVHALEEPDLRFQQLAVLRALLRSHLVVLVVSPSVLRSPWVRLELGLAHLLMRPVIRLDVSALERWAAGD